MTQAQFETVKKLVEQGWVVREDGNPPGAPITIADPAGALFSVGEDGKVTPLQT